MDNNKNKTIQTDHGQILPVKIVEEMEKSYLDYAMSVIVSRALPDVRDGLKPVHRRILYAMHSMGVLYKTPYKKSARIVGEVIGKFHPHGDSPVYDALVRMAQTFSMRYPLVDGQGNFGSVDGDPPAAMRYTEARLHKISQELLSNIGENTVDFIDNFDGSESEPTVLPALLPNLLLMGSDGIAVGMATKIPPHNLREVVAAITVLIDKGKSIQTDDQKAALKDPETDRPEILVGEFESEAQIEDLTEQIKGPDFPTGAQIYDTKAIKEIYATGKGKIMVRAIASIVEKKNGRFSIKVTELPYQVNKANLIAKIADLVRKKKLDGISDIRDESDRTGLTVAIELKKDARPQQVLNNLYKHTDLQTSYPANFVALDPTLTPHVMNLKQITTEYVKHRQLVIVRRSQFELKSARARVHILEGLLKALDHIDEIISTIKKSKDSEDAKKNLISKFGFSEIQAQAILDMQLRKLAALERQKLQDEYDALMKRIDFLLSIITKPAEILKVIKTELKRLVDDYGDDRRTKINKNALGTISDEELINAEEVIVALTKTGYIKRMPKGTFKTQRRGGKGVAGMTKKEQDEMYLLTSANTHDDLLIFTNQGRVFKIKVWDIPESSRTAKGSSIVNFINTNQNEAIQALLPIPTEKEDLKNKFLTFTTEKGYVKRTVLSAFQNIKSNGLISINLQKDDRLVWVKPTLGQDEILLITHLGKCIRFKESEVRPTGRDTMGVKGIAIKGDDYVIAMETITKVTEPPVKGRRKVFTDILVITENGLGKRTPISEYPAQKRSGQGVKVAEITQKTGPVASALMVTHNTDQVIITTREAVTIKLPVKNIPQLQRPTQGVILMRFAKVGDTVSAVASLEKEVEEAKS